MTRFTRPLTTFTGFCCLLLLFCVQAKADTLTIRESQLDGQKIRLTAYFDAWEDPTRKTDTTDFFRNQQALVPLTTIDRQSRTSYYWLSMYLKNGTDTIRELMLAFTSLTYVDVYLYKDGALLDHKITGHFRPEKYFEKGNGRLNVGLTLEPAHTYRLVLKVYHSKRYDPVFNFFLQPKDDYIAQSHHRELIDGWAQGAVLVFFVYALLSWLVSRFRPYLWLMCFIVGIGFYGITSAGYFIEWFFPNNPERGWLFNTVAAHLGSFGIYMLLIDFWEMKKYNPMLYRLGVMLTIELLLLTGTGFVINAVSGNFNLVNTINLWSFPLPLGFMLASLFICWKRLSPPKKYLGYGLILFFCAAAYTVLSSAILHERSIIVAPYLSNFITLTVFLLFATGLKEELRQHEIDKKDALAALNELQKDQNAILEKKVEDRTSQLLISNERLTEQTALLADRNTKIETLINELNHRVKNNLQLLYSLISLQVPSIADQSSREILKGNLGKIKAMMLVNQKLFRFEENSSVRVDEFTSELTNHLQKIYDSKGKISIDMEVDKGIMLHGKITLSFGLILSELLTNSFKYAFADHDSPAIDIKVSITDDQCILFVYADNGAGMDIHNKGERITMGVSLVQDLTRQMNGKLQIENKNGLRYEFLIPT